MTEGVSVIVLAGSESTHIERVVERCVAALTVPTEIIIVADESLTLRHEDSTSQLSVERDRTKVSKTSQSPVIGGSYAVRVVRQNADESRSQAVADGFKRAHHDYWVVIDTDRQHSPEKLPVLVRALSDGADIAIANHSRDGRGYRKRIAFTLMKFGLNVSPSLSRSAITSDLFAVHRDAVDLEDLDPWGYTILLDVLVRHNIERSDDIRLKTDSEKGFSWTECLTIAEQTLALFFVRLRLDRVIAPVRALRATEYALIGGIGTVINMLIFAGVHLGLGIHYLLAGVLAFIVALNWNFLGNWALTFDRPHDGLRSKYWKFIAVSLVGFVLYSGILTVSIDYFQLPVLLSNGIAIIGAATFNFLGSEMFAFSVRALD